MHDHDECLAPTDRDRGTRASPAAHGTRPMPTDAARGASRVLVVDHHPIVREGLRRILENAAGSWIVTEAGGGYEALELLRTQAFDLAVVDITMPRMTGLEFLGRVRIEFPAMRLLMMSIHSDEEHAFRAFRMGASGYVTKDSAAQQLAEALGRLRDGGTYVSPGLAERMVSNLNGTRKRAPHAQLSRRELDVMRRLVAGKRPTEIAQALSISVKTVSTYKSRILDRMQIPNAAALVRYAIEHDLMTDEVDAKSAD